VYNIQEYLEPINLDEYAMDLRSNISKDDKQYIKIQQL
jgi:hypothetical protein